MQNKVLTLKQIFGINGEVPIVRVDPETIAYAVGGVVVIYDGKDQTVLRGHSSLVTCIATSYRETAEGVNDGRLIVSGQRDPKGVGKPFALVWTKPPRGKTYVIAARLDGPDKFVAAVAVASEQRIVVAGGDDHNTIFIYRNFQLVQSLATGKSVISYLVFGQRNVAVGSRDTLKVFDVGSEKLGKSLVIRSATALYHEQHGIILDIHGKVFSFQQKLPLAQFPKTQYFCWAIFGKKLFGISAEREVYTATLDESGNWIIASREYAHYSTDKISSLAWPYFATRDNVFGCVAQGGNVQLIQISTFKEAWGLAIHPTKALAVTGDFSGRLLFFDLINVKPVVNRFVNCGLKIFSAAFSPDGKYLAVGQDDGWLTIFKFEDFKEIFQRKVGNERITELLYSPDAQNLIVGCWDQMIYIVRRDFTVAGALKGHSSSPVSVQLSQDGKFVISDSKDGQTLCWRLSDGERVTKGVRDLGCVPDGWTGVLDPMVASIWDDGRYGDRSDINTVAQKGELLVTGDDLGSINLFPFPCPRGTAAIDHQHNVHFAAVTRVAFAPTGLFVSIGGIDHLMCLWEIKDKSEAQDASISNPTIRRSWDGN
jgi:WD40 repeat protein